MGRIARNLTDAEEGILMGERYLIDDRDPLFTAASLSLIAGAGVEPVRLQRRSPNRNASAERLVCSIVRRNIRESCLERMICFGEESLYAVCECWSASNSSWGAWLPSLYQVARGRIDWPEQAGKRSELNRRLKAVFREGLLA